MAGDTQETTSSEPQVSEALETSQYEAALAHLERLQEQLDNLRSVIPALVAPIAQPASSKEQLLANVRQSALQTTKDLKAFRESWQSEQTQQLFTRSKQSLKNDGDLTKSVDVAKWGWSAD